MTARNNLRADPFEELARRVAKLESARPLGNSDVSRGNTIFRGIRSLVVKGSQYVEGLLEGIGDFVWRGSMKITGLGTLGVEGPATFSATLDVTAATRLRGPTTIEDTLDVTAETRLRGDATLEKNLTLKDGGKVTVEGPNALTVGITSADVPGIEFADGGAFVGVEDGVQLNNADGNGFVYASEDVGMQRGSNSLSVTPDAIYLRGPVFMPRLPTISGVSANVTVDPVTGELGVI
jgi:hypothetical protein